MYFDQVKKHYLQEMRWLPLLSDWYRNPPLAHDSYSQFCSICLVISINFSRNPARAYFPCIMLFSFPVSSWYLSGKLGKAESGSIIRRTSSMYVLSFEVQDNVPMLLSKRVHKRRMWAHTILRTPFGTSLLILLPCMHVCTQRTGTPFYASCSED
jgi:hypothetical protein